MNAHVSIHDVAPDTLTLVGQMLDQLKTEAGVTQVMLLVIPGLNWQADQLQQLRDWATQGHHLAGHGWVHQVTRRGRFYHKLHGLFISRYVAEHLSLDYEGIAELMQRNYDWFGSHDLPSPGHYVPPAWALGRIPVSRLAALPFQTVETLTGIWMPHENRFQKMPLLGYEADTALRACFLRTFNAWNRRKASVAAPIRISLHPQDFSLKLAEEILLDCRRYRCQPQFA